jgi:hypothetical protein
MPKVITCEDCGEIEMAYLDGYHVADRLLEGVCFEIRIEHGKIKATTAEEDQDYMSNLNEKKFLKVAAQYAEGDECLECPKCGDEATIVNG